MITVTCNLPRELGSIPIVGKFTLTPIEIVSLVHNTYVPNSLVSHGSILPAHGQNPGVFLLDTLNGVKFNQTVVSNCGIIDDLSLIVKVNEDPACICGQDDWDAYNILSAFAYTAASCIENNDVDGVIDVLIRQDCILYGRKTYDIVCEQLHAKHFGAVNLGEGLVWVLFRSVEDQNLCINDLICGVFSGVTQWYTPSTKS